MRLKPWLLSSLALGLAGLLGWAVYDRLEGLGDESAKRAGRSGPVPVELAAVERGPIALRRSFAGTLDAHAQFVAAPKVGGRIDRLYANLADRVTRGQLVASLDNAEYVQAVNQAQADLAVANANLGEAKSLLEIAERELARVVKLRARGVSSESQRDTAQADQLAKQAHLEVARAQVTRAEAALETARIRLGYTQVTAGWRGGSEQRVVAERYVDEGETVSANAPLLRIVELDPITAAFHVTERDYSLLRTGQAAELRTDAYPERVFRGEVARIAPVFLETARQARVELRVDNPERLLKPGMFVRASLVLDRVDDAVIVPEQAPATRDGHPGLFVLAADRGSVRWREVRLGILEAGRQQVLGEDLGEQVVVVGQQLLEDGSAVSVAGAVSVAKP